MIVCTTSSATSGGFFFLLNWITDLNSSSLLSRRLASGVGSIIGLGNSLFDFLSKSEEGLINFAGALGGSLQKFNSQGISVLFSLIVGDGSLAFQIGFVSDQQLHDIVIGELIDFSEPVLDILEALFIGDIIDQNNSMSSLIIAGSDSLKSFLSSSIPDLKFNSFSLQIESSNFEINSNSW